VIKLAPLVFLILTGCVSTRPYIYDVIGSMSSKDIDYNGLTVTPKGKVKFKTRQPWVGSELDK